MKKLSYLLKKYDIISVLIMIFITILFVLYNYFNINKISILDFTIFSSVAIIATINVLGKILSILIVSKYEDRTKLEDNYNILNKLYVADDLLTYTNSNKNIVTFPIIQDYQYNDEIKIKIEDSKQMYNIPDDIKQQTEHLFSAHNSSIIYNQLNVRVDDLFLKDNLLIIKTSRTTYFNSLLTNRSMDYLWTNGFTTRQLYAYGPFAPKFKNSELSNHLGFNGIVESIDGYIPLIKRGKSVSIGKRTYGTSIGASLKTKAALNKNEELTNEGLLNAVYDEINDELNIDKDALISTSLEKTIISSYRELVEGGKPQLAVVVKSKLDKDEITKMFLEKSKRMKKKKSMHSKVIMDGNQIEWISKEDLNNATFNTNSIIIGNKTFNMTPSSVATIVMYLQYLYKKN